jgi:amino acid permease
MLYLSSSSKPAGAGILGLPRTLDKAGVLLGLALITLGGLGAIFGLKLLAFCVRGADEPASYYSLARRAYPPSTWVIDGAVALKCFGVACSYLLVIGRLLPDAFTYFDTGVSALEDRHFWQTSMMVVIVPLCLLAELRTLRFVSLFALLAIAYLVVFIFAYFFAELSTVRTDISLASVNGDTLLVVPTIIFSFTCHQNMPTILTEMREKTRRASDFVIHVAIVSCWCVYAITALLGFLTFGPEITDNVINNYPVSNMFANSVRLAVGMSCLACIPFQIHPARTCTLNLLFGRSKLSGNKNFMLGARIAVGCLLCFAMYMVAFFLTDLGLMFAVIGATGSTTICYLLPAFFYLRIGSAEGTPALQHGAWAMLVVGAIMMVAGLYSAIAK